MTDSTLDFHPPEEFRRIAAELETAGFQAWAVGGALRDELLGRARADWDLATDARPEEIQGVFRRTVPIGIDHGTVGVLDSAGTLYEVTTFRRDVETDGRHAVIEFADRIEDDLARRDFTINTIAWRPATGEVRDPFGGAEDLEARLLRAVGVAGDRFAEDYLRVLRGLRFVGRFDLEMEPQTAEALAAATPGLAGLSAERVREELMKVLTGPAPAATLALYADAGALEPWYHELAAVVSGPAWDLGIAALDELADHRPMLRLVRLLALTEDESESRRASADALMERLKFSNAARRRAAHLVEHYADLPGPTDSSARLREWLAECRPDAARDLFRLAFADARARGATETCRVLLFVWGRVHEELTGDRPLELADVAVSGDDLIEIGVPVGPMIGLFLDELHARVLEDPDLNERDALLEIGRELLHMTQTGDDAEGGAA